MTSERLIGVRVGGGMPAKGDGEPQFTDTFRPHLAYGSWQNTENRQ